MKNTALLGILAVLVLEAGCMMGPKYKRPAVNVPQEYRTPEPQLAAQASSLGNEQWWQLYQDPVLTQLIHTAIAQNYDVRIAAARVLEAQAQVGITRSNQFPSASVGADIYSQQNAKVTKVFPAYQVNAGDRNLSASAFNQPRPKAWYGCSTKHPCHFRQREDHASPISLQKTRLPFVR